MLFPEIEGRVLILREKIVEIGLDDGTRGRLSRRIHLGIGLEDGKRL